MGTKCSQVVNNIGLKRGSGMRDSYKEESL